MSRPEARAAIHALIPRVSLAALGGASVGTLLLYFFGVGDFGQVVLLLFPVGAALVILGFQARSRGDLETYHRLVAGLLAGAAATLAYDLCRVPLVWSGIPVFKAISYFGTVMLGQGSPTVASEIAGWGYHLSNGIGFGLVYAAVVDRPRWWTAVIWGLVLEGVMWLTPYAEVFGYRRSAEFLAITIGAHVVYGLALWATLRWLLTEGDFHALRLGHGRHAATACVVLPIALGAISADFQTREGGQLPPSPPGYLGPGLYVTWNVPEPDRLAALWVLSRFVDSTARFHFVPPFSHAPWGTIFDAPEAQIRRDATRAATEVLLADAGLTADPRLRLVAEMAHLTEIAPWQLPAHRPAAALALELRAAAAPCGEALTLACIEPVFGFLDRWFAEPLR